MELSGRRAGHKAKGLYVSFGDGDEGVADMTVYLVEATPRGRLLLSRVDEPSVMEVVLAHLNETELDQMMACLNLTRAIA